MMRAAFCLLLGTTLTIQAEAPSGSALQIGNAHQGEALALSNPARDATDVAARRRALGIADVSSSASFNSTRRAMARLELGNAAHEGDTTALAMAAGNDPKADAAVIKITGRNLPKARSRESLRLNAAHPVMAISVLFCFDDSTAARIIALDSDEQLEKTAFVARGWLGVRIMTMNQALADYLGLPESGGTLVVSVDHDSPAAGVGLERGDVILQLDGQPVTDSKALAAAIGGREPGTRVSLQIWSHLASRNVRVELGFWPTRPSVPDSSAPGPE
jgi:hypothetical protein